MLTLKFKHITLSSLFIAVLAASNAHAAAVIDPSTEPFNVLPPYTVSNTDVSSGTAKAYRTWFENGNFTGDLVEYNVSSGGRLSTSVDLSVYPPTNTAGTNWSARLQFRAKGTDYWDDTRKIIFHNGSVQKAFRWGNLSDSQKNDLGDSENVLKFIRGDQSKETDKTNGTFRQRTDLLGDIIHSNPVYVAAPDSPLTVLPGYHAFSHNISTVTPAGHGHADRDGRVYVGANDGMIHAFDAETGDEVWAYIPSMILGKLDKLSEDPAPSHQYFVDGQLNEGDADFKDETDPEINEWHSLLFGGLGAGGKGLFALDITSAALSSETAYTGTDKKVLFEIDDSSDDIGHIHGKVELARLHNNKWVLISGNGYDSDNGHAVLLLIDMNGTVTPVPTNETTNNGLSAPILVDVNGDKDVDFGYAGDLQGNMWKFDFTGDTVSSELLFTGSVDKPITAIPDVRVHPFGGRLVLFGTGSLLSATDATYKTTNQSIYAIWDGAPEANTTLLTQTLDSSIYNHSQPAEGENAGYDITYTVRTASNNTVNWAIHKGWQVDLSPGERLVSTPIIRADRLQLTTHNPTSEGGADAWLLELNGFNGGSPLNPFLDLNEDTGLNNYDKVDRDTDTPKTPMGLYMGKGSFSGPTIARISLSRDTKFINALLFPETSEPCTEDCSEGFRDGHIDVDTDSPFGGDVAALESDSYCFVDGERTQSVTVEGVTTHSVGNACVSRNGQAYVRSGKDGDGLGGKTDGHHHEYDKKHEQVYVDYINLEPLCESDQKLNRVTEAKSSDDQKFAYDKKFFAVVANADLSPHSTFKIADQEWNVVEYQKMIQQKIDAWIAAGKLTLAASDNNFEKMMKDGDDSLLFSIDEIKASNKKMLRHAFDDSAIVKGGLLPTSPSCVKEYTNSTLGDHAVIRNTGRWRGGALITQFIDVEEYKSNTDLLQYQIPTDLYRSRTVKSGGSDLTVVLKVDEDGDGTYEKTFGGLLATAIGTTTTETYRHHGEDRTRTVTTFDANPAFLYESTLFWHNNAHGCYASDDWNAGVVAAAVAGTDPTLKNTVASLESDLEKIELALASGNYSDEVLARMRIIKTAIEAEIKKIKDSYADESGSIEYTGTVAPPTDGKGTLIPALGPNFRPGRRTWIDLSP